MDNPNTQWFSSLDEALKSIEDFQKTSFTKFRRFTEHKTDVKRCKIRWAADIPYVILRNKQYKCNERKKFCKDNSPNQLKKKYQKLDNVKCAASIFLMEMLKFPQFKTNDRSRGSISSIKQQLQEYVASDDYETMKEYSCAVTFPSPSDHSNHQDVPMFDSSSTESEHNTSTCEKKQIQLLIRKSKASGNSRLTKCFPSLEAALKSIKDFEKATASKYIMLSNKKFDLSKSRIRWEDSSKTPYVMVRHKQLECHRGKDRNKAYNELRVQRKVSRQAGGSLPKRHLTIQISKKRNCKAILSILETIRFPQHKLVTLRPGLKASTSETLRVALRANDPSLLKERAFIVTFPPSDAHSGHATLEALEFFEGTDHRLVAKIRELVDEGVRNVAQIKSSLQFFIANVLFKDQQTPPVSNRRFYPTDVDLHAEFYRAFVQRKASKMDLTAVKSLIDDLKCTLSPDDKFVYRSFIVGNLCNDICPIIEDQSAPVIQCKQRLLFVHQSQWQRRLLHKFGKTVVFLYPVYKAINHPLPFYFLYVKTNVGYQVAASFVMQNERSFDISEGLGFIKRWNCDWNPEYFFSGISSEEVEAIRYVFPNCRVLYCDVIREQEWDLWIKKRENGIEEQDREAILSQLREMAGCSDENTFIMAEHNLKKMDCFKTNSNLLVHLENTWLSEVQRWACLYRDEKISALLMMNRGREKQIKFFEECSVKFKTNHSLSDILSVLLKDFLPETKAKYEHLNTVPLDQTTDRVPDWLMNRPIEILQHCMKRMAIANDNDDCYEITKESERAFLVSNEAESCQVFLGDEDSSPKCSCFDFNKYFLPCEHIFALFNRPKFSWFSLPEWYRESPFMLIDPCMVIEILQTNDMSTESPEIEVILDNDDFNISSTADASVDRIFLLLREIREMSATATSRLALAKTESSLKSIRDDLLTATSNEATIVADINHFKAEDIRRSSKQSNEVHQKSRSNFAFSSNISVVPRKKSKFCHMT